MLDIPLDSGFLRYEIRKYLGPSETGQAKPPERFHPFTLEPGQERLIVLRGAYANCDKFAPGTSVGISSVPFRERFLLWTRTVRIDLLRPVVIRMPAHRSPCSTG